MASREKQYIQIEFCAVLERSFTIARTSVAQDFESSGYQGYADALMAANPPVVFWVPENTTQRI